ncbi:hypothetical protein CcaverHIS631_0100010, partial [Cutaneotrichosporon cavernicola]
ELEFLTTDAADRALAILNTHPALADTGMSFCLPGDPSVRAYPELRTLFTRSLGHAQPRTCKCRRVCLRNAGGYMNAAYDELIVYGPIHYVTVCSTDEDVDYTRRGAIWHIMVQFFDPDVAAIVDHSLTSFLGRRVTVIKSPLDVTVARLRKKINAERAERGEPPLGPPSHAIQQSASDDTSTEDSHPSSATS